MLIITNRKIVSDNFVNGVGDQGAFADVFSEKGPNELRLAHAEKVDGRWKVRLVDEPANMSAGNLPSRQEFEKLRDKLIQTKRHCVLFVHGFNQSFEKNLEKSRKLSLEHDVEVVAFSWPSNPGGIILKEYKTAKKAALASVNALDAVLEKIGEYLRGPFERSALISCGIKFSLLTYSLGSFLFENYVKSSDYEAETQIFDNVILCQSDVDNEGHRGWVEKISTGKRLYVTINENDWVLKWSDVNFQRDRLGRTAKNLNARNAIYVDFTDGDDVGRTHEIFYEETNSVVKSFFSDVFRGKRGERTPGLRYEAESNTYRFD